MHSKVIIASLVCMLAGSLNFSKGATTAFAEKEVEPIVQKTVNHAPNDYPTRVSFANQDGLAGTQLYATIDFEKSQPDFRILQRSGGIDVDYDFYQYYADVGIMVPTTPGLYSVKFGYYSGTKQIILAKIFIYTDGNHYCASSNSENEVKARFFHQHRATQEELEYISYRDYANYKYGEYNSYNTARYDAEKRCSTFVYGSTQDVVANTTVYPHWGGSTTTYLILHAFWTDINGVNHPLKGVRTDFISKDNSILGIGDLHFTNQEGQYVVAIPQSETIGSMVSDIKCRLSSVSLGTCVEDSFYQNYPICYSLSESTLLSNCSEIDYYIYVKSGRSDRADAYEITQAQDVPYRYANDYGCYLDTVITQFPSDCSAFYKYPRRLDCIKVQKEDAHSWDILNHEYGHFMCDQLNLCSENTSVNYHDVHDDLGKFGEDLAFSEGLATYLGIAAQMSRAGTINIDGFADEIYQDPYRGFTVDYNTFAPGYSYNDPFYGERVESSVTSVLLKMLDNVYRPNDYVALGHAKMWNILLHFSNNNPCESIVELIDTAITLYPAYALFIKKLKKCENIMDYFVAQDEMADWTIMLYICGSDLESGDKKKDGSWESNTPSGLASDDIAEILKVKNKPSNVNILIETGGSERWKNDNVDPTQLCKFKVTNNNGNSVLTRVDTLPYQSMGAGATFEEFLDWGFRNYPAKKTGVILWNHGGNFSCCSDDVLEDETEGSESLDDLEVVTAFQNTFYKNRIEKLEFIGYDCCCMQQQDVAELNSPYCKYMVASQESEPGTGWAYDKWIDDVYARRPTTTILKEICNTYISSIGGSGTLSVLNLSQMANYKIKFEEVASSLNTVPFIAVHTAALNSFSIDFHGTNCGWIDGLSFMNCLLNNSELMEMNGLRAKVCDAIDAYNLLVYYNKTKGSDNGKANGMSIYYAGARKYATGLPLTTLAIILGLTQASLTSVVINTFLSQYGEPYYPAQYTNFNSWRSLCLE